VSTTDIHAGLSATAKLYGRAYVYSKRSALDVGEVPSGEVTVTSTSPEPAGAVALIEISEFTLKVAEELPKLTPVAPDRLRVAPTRAPPTHSSKCGRLPLFAFELEADRGQEE
jgi:hypothetical protein